MADNLTRSQIERELDKIVSSFPKSSSALSSRGDAYREMCLVPSLYEIGDYSKISQRMKSARELLKQASDSLSFADPLEGALKVPRTNGAINTAIRIYNDLADKLNLDEKLKAYTGEIPSIDLKQH